MSLKNFTRNLQAQKEASDSNAHTDVLEAIRARATDIQKKFLADKRRKIAIRGSRRVGKTFAIALKLFTTALTRPGSKNYYLALTKPQCRDNVWPYLKQFADEHEITCKFHETYLSCKLPNGSIIKLHGAETRDEIEKLRGGANGIDLVIIDECKSFAKKVLKELVKDILGPALADTMGTIVLIGTPGNVLDKENIFYQATCNIPEERDKAWSTHVWHVSQNTAKPHIWEVMLSEKEHDNVPDDDPTWLREGMGQWAASDSMMVYPISDANLWQADSEGPHGLPHGYEWHYLLGADIGFRDDTAFTVLAYSDNHPHLFHVGGWKEPGLTYDGIKKNVDKLLAIYGEFDGMVIDAGGLGKTILESLNEDGYPFEAARKTDKFDHIALLNTEMQAGRFKILEGSALETEMRMLQFRKTEAGKLVEDASCENHACDSALYIHRWALHNLWEPAATKIVPRSDEWYAEMEERAIAAAEAEISSSGDFDVEDHSFSLDQGFPGWI